MKAKLLHLSGPQRGATIVYPGPRLTLGSLSGAEIWFPPVGAIALRHAQIDFIESDCSFHLRALEGAVFVNGREVREIILEEGDLIELGAGGPKIRFRVHYEPGAVCKPVRQMLLDAADVGGESGFRAALRGLRLDLLFHSSWLVKGVLSTIIVLVAFGSAYLGGAIAGRREHQSHEHIRSEQRESIRAELAEMRDALRRQLHDFECAQGGRASRAELEALGAELSRRGAVVDSLLARNEALRRVLDEYSRSVCLLYGVYSFRVPDQANGPPIFGLDGGPLEIEYMGSGFLASADGFVLTNRHVAEPWWNNHAVSGLLEQGAVPDLVRLEAYFPGLAALRLDPRTVRISQDGVDVALVRVATDAVKLVPSLPLFTGDLRALLGSPVILLGYPTGINAVVARAEPDVVNKILSEVTDTRGLLERLAELSLITPVITQGALNEVRERRLVYDAETTSGGSGGPVFALNGAVIGVNFAITRDFAGTNFGVPIEFGRRLLTQAQEELVKPSP